MACTRETVRMSGILRNSMQTANCMVSALRVTLAGTRFFKDCRYSFEWISRPLPDGNYKLSFDGKTVDMSHFKGNWRERLILKSVKVQPTLHLQPKHPDATGVQG